MFASLGRVVTRFPWYVIGAWFIVGIAIVATAPGLKATTDQSDFLPRHYESIQAAELQSAAFPDQRQPGAIIVFDHADGSPLSTADVKAASGAVAQVKGKLGPAFSGVGPVTTSQNKLVAFAVVGLAEGQTGYDTGAFDSVTSLRSDLAAATASTGLREGVTGTVAQNYDSQQSSKNAEAIVGIATVLLIIVLLGLIFRSVIITLLPIVVVGLASTVATGLIGFANKIFDLKIDSSVQVILIVVLFGIGTDYILFFLFRYRERLRAPELAAQVRSALGPDATEKQVRRAQTRAGVEYAVTRAGEAIASAGGAVIVAFLALLLSSLGIFKSIGPALAIAVAVTLLAALTLVPAVVTLLGRPLFWPSKSWQREPSHATFGRIGSALGRRPAVFAAASGGLLVVLAVFALQFNPTFDLNSASTSSSEESAQTLTRFEKGFPPGATDPTTVFLHSTDGQALSKTQVATEVSALQAVDGVAQVVPAAASSDGQTVPLSVTLRDDPSSTAAITVVKGPLRDAAHAAAGSGAEALVGGTTSVFVDFQAAMDRDYTVVFPVAAVVILLILALLLRSLVAPIYLMVSVGLGFAATLGATVLVFQNIKGDAGIIFLLPIYIYLFVVALGTDYNILMIARLREEAREGRPPREAAAETIKHAAPTVAAAGLILAGTFASLMLAGNGLLVRMGFSISLGIAVSAFVMSLFFTPALTALIGHAAWWPGHGDETDEAKTERLASHV